MIQKKKPSKKTSTPYRDGMRPFGTTFTDLGL